MQFGSPRRPRAVPRTVLPPARRAVAQLHKTGQQGKQWRMTRFIEHIHREREPEEHFGGDVGRDAPTLTIFNADRPVDCLAVPGTASTAQRIPMIAMPLASGGRVPIAAVGAIGAAVSDRARRNRDLILIVASCFAPKR